VESMLHVRGWSAFGLDLEVVEGEIGFGGFWVQP
jgi:hypothetical protein